MGSDLLLAGGKTKIPERYQEQMCGLLTLRLYIQPTDKALAYETRRWDASGRVCILHNRCYQRQEITHPEESSDSEGTMCYANGSSKWHTPAY